MKSELEGHAEIGTFSDESVPWRVKDVSAKWVIAGKTDSDGFITKGRARLVARRLGQ